jgi:hypothetical protein
MWMLFHDPGDWRIFAKNITETLVIFRERIAYIIHEILDTRILSAKWVSKCLNVDQKRNWVLTLQAILVGSCVIF